MTGDALTRSAAAAQAGQDALALALTLATEAPAWTTT